MEQNKAIEARLMHLEAECQRLSEAVMLLRRMVKENSGTIRDFLLTQIKKDQT